MQILVTGANGLVGSRLVRVLGDDGCRVTAVGRGECRICVGSRGRYLALDLTDADATAALVHDVRPDVIVHCAAMTEVDGCERDPEGAWDSNVGAVATLCRAARRCGSHVVALSTDYVFDGEAGPYDVDAVPNPRGAYATTKHIAEQTVRVLCAEGRWTIARTAVVFGWPPAGQRNFGSWLVESLRAGRPVTLFSDQWVSPTAAPSAAAMIAEIAQRRLAGIHHVCGGEIVDRVAFGRRLCERFGYDPGLIRPTLRKDVALATPRPRNTALLVTKTLQTLRSRPLMLDDALDVFRAEVGDAVRAT